VSISSFKLRIVVLITIFWVFVVLYTLAISYIGGDESNSDVIVARLKKILGQVYLMISKDTLVLNYMPINYEVSHFFPFIVQSQLESDMAEVKVDDDLPMEVLTTLQE
jgi:hypothetical protein